MTRLIKARTASKYDLPSKLMTGLAEPKIVPYQIHPGTPFGDFLASFYPCHEFCRLGSQMRG